MNITYTYEIISVDEAARCMEVVYTADGHPTMHIGARLPFEGEVLEDIVALYAPVAYWKSLKTPVVVPAVGTTGVVASVVEEPPSPSPTPQTAELIEPIFPTPAMGQIDVVIFE